GGDEPRLHRTARQPSGPDRGGCPPVGVGASSAHPRRIHPRADAHPPSDATYDPLHHDGTRFHHFRCPVRVVGPGSPQPPVPVRWSGSSLPDSGNHAANITPADGGAHPPPSRARVRVRGLGGGTIFLRAKSTHARPL